jgi:predicted flavoprotein YhiN
MRPGEAMISDDGIEGSLVYALSAAIRERIKAEGRATLLIDLAPGRSLERCRPKWPTRGRPLLASHLQPRRHRRRAMPCCGNACRGRAGRPPRLAAAIKALPLTLAAPRPWTRPSAAPVACASRRLDAGLMIRTVPGVFCSGEMLDWEAPTGGYLLTACLATGRRAGEGVLAWLARR